jgi:hypothetical protein
MERRRVDPRERGCMVTHKALDFTWSTEAPLA